MFKSGSGNDYETENCGTASEEHVAADLVSQAVFRVIQSQTFHVRDVNQVSLPRSPAQALTSRT